MRIFVIGASGRLGRCILQEGGRRRHRFTAQTRARKEESQPAKA